MTVTVLMSSGCAPTWALPAFPGAVGYGQNAVGWRGGSVVKVTNTDDAGPGSLRDCLEGLDHPRVCIIETSGTIALDRGIFVQPNVYLAGQTAPGDGIQLRLSGKDDGSPPLIIKNSHDVLIRNLKSRPGPGAVPTPSVSALLIENAERIMLDRLSLMFASDQVFTVHIEGGTSRDITLQRSIVAYGLDQSNHPKGRHSKGALVCAAAPGAVDNGDRCGFITLWRNLFAHHNDRNPDLKSTSMPMQVVNNVIFNPRSQFGEFYDRFGSMQVDYIGNVLMAGLNTSSSPVPYPVQLFDFEDAFEVSLFTHDNLMAYRRQPPASGREHIVHPLSQGHVTDRPLTLGNMPLPILPAADVVSAVLADTGDHLPGARPPDRLDRLVMDDLKHRTGSIIDHPGEVGGYPEPKGGEVPADRDGDGMSDLWEESHDGLDPDRFDAWNDHDGDGWSNLETYLSALSGDVLESPADPTSLAPGIQRH
jgi:hypothetical protein